jgi:hypothetical protein
MGRSLTTKEFIIRARKIHGDRYDYSESVYVDYVTKLNIKCKIHGIFEQSPAKHINRKQNCPMCMNRDMSTDKFISRAKEVHGDKYDYSESKYINAKTNVKIYCNICDTYFHQTPDHHLNRKDGCPLCRNKQNGRNLRLSLNEIISKSKKANYNRYDYSITKYAKYHDKIRFICPTHGKVEQYTKHHLKGVGCPICRESKGEKRIRLFLKNNKIRYTYNKSFDDCKHIRQLPFDFHLPEYNTIIEYDGELHYNPTRYNKNKEKNIQKLKSVKRNDNIKNQYCKNNNIILIRIPYWDFDNIEKILKRELY